MRYETDDQEAEEQDMSLAMCGHSPRKRRAHPPDGPPRAAQGRQGDACAKSVQTQTCRQQAKLVVPCHLYDPDLWFAENPVELERAKSLCAECPIRRECLAAALEREEPWGVWGGEIFERGTVIARKRPRGRPRKNTEGNPAAA